MTRRMAPNLRAAFRASIAGQIAAFAVMLLASLVAVSAPALALKPIEIGQDQGRLDVTPLADLYEGRGDSLQVETAAGADGLASRMSVSAATPGDNPNWIVFALTNSTDKPVERWLSAARYSVIGSGVVWPDLDAQRIEAITPSVGFVPERIKSDRADLFRITLEPGQTITYVAELSSERFARLHLWKPLDYEIRISDRQLFNGVLLGLTGLMAIFLTAIFAANHKLVFPASALVAWCVLAHLCVDFGFFHKLFQLKPEANAVYRAASEAALAASLVVFLHVFLRLALWHGLIRMLITVWLLAQFSLIAVAIIDPRLAATFARLSFLFIGLTGTGLILFLALRGQDRALSLIPTWILFLVWIFGAGVALTGKLTGEAAVFGLVSGMVLIVLSIGFTVTQYAFRSVEPLHGAAPTELQARSIAVDASGAAVWEWNARRDEVKVSQSVEALLGLSPGDLSTRTDDFMRHLHPADRERFRLALFTVQERRDGKVCCEFRLRQADNNYRWFELEAAGVPGSDPRSFKCVGLVRDVTDAKRAHERLLHDAVHDSLTGLPNRELLLDRLEVAMVRAKSEPQIRPTALIIDIDKFTSLSSSLGLVLGDSLLLTIARRLQRHLGPNDTLGRISGDRFCLLLLADQPVAELAQHAERIRRSLRSPIKISGEEIVLTGSIGIAIFDGEESNHADLLKKAEIAMFRAKRAGADRIEVFTPEMKGDQDDRHALEAELRRALEKNAVRVAYYPVVYLPTEELAGFEAVARWDHPQLGTIDPSQFSPLSEDNDLIARLGIYLLQKASRDVVVWQKEFPRGDSPLFASVNISCRHLFRPDVIQEVRHILGRTVVPKGSLRIEVTEQVTLENPEQSTEVLEWLRSSGAEIVLDEFGTGYSSLSYLDRLPFDSVKIDQAIMQAGDVKGGNDSVLLRSMVALGHELGKKIVAKGVEAAGEVSFLRSIECEYAQGPYCGDAIADTDVVQVLATVKTSENKVKPVGVFRPKARKKAGKPQAPQQRPDAQPGMAAANGQAAPPRANGKAEHAANGHAAKGAPNGHASNGHASNGHAPNGHAPNGHLQNGQGVPPEIQQGGNGKGAPMKPAVAAPRDPATGALARAQARLRAEQPAFGRAPNGAPPAAPQPGGAPMQAAPQVGPGQPMHVGSPPPPPSNGAMPPQFAGAPAAAPPPVPQPPVASPTTRLSDVLPNVAALDATQRPPARGAGFPDAPAGMPPVEAPPPFARAPAPPPVQPPQLRPVDAPPSMSGPPPSPAWPAPHQGAPPPLPGGPPRAAPPPPPAGDAVSRPVLVQPMPQGAPPSAPVAPPPQPAGVRPAAPQQINTGLAPQPIPPDFSNLPPAIAESLARLAGVARKPG